MFGLGKRRKKSRTSANAEKKISLPPNIKLTEEQRKAMLSSSGIGRLTDLADPKLQKWNIKER